MMWRKLKSNRRLRRHKVPSKKLTLERGVQQGRRCNFLRKWPSEQNQKEEQKGSEAGEVWGDGCEVSGGAGSHCRTLWRILQNVVIPTAIDSVWFYYPWVSGQFLRMYSAMQFGSSLCLLRLVHQRLSAWLHLLEPWPWALDHPKSVCLPHGQPTMKKPKQTQSSIHVLKPIRVKIDYSIAQHPLKSRKL